MLMEFMRPRSTQEYEVAIYESVAQFPKVVKDFNIIDYDINIANRIDQIVSDVLFIDGWARHNISAEQEKCLPQVKWGDPGGIDRGVIQMATACLRPYVGNFKSMIATKFGEKALKELKDLNLWAKRVIEVNDEKTRMAIQLRMANLSATPGDRVEVIQSQVDESRTRQHFVAGRGEKRFPEERRRGPENLGRIEHVQHPSQAVWAPYPVQHSYLEQYSNHYAIQYADQYPVQYDGGYHEQYEWEQQEYAAHYGPRLQAVDWQNPAHPERGTQPVRNLHNSGGGRQFGGGQRDQGRGRGGPPMRGGGGRAGRFGARGVPEYGRDRPPPAGVIPKPIGFAPDRPV